MVHEARRHLVLIHGGGVGPWMWRKQVEHFAGDFVVHTPTLPGHDPRASRDFTTNRDAAQSVADQVDLSSLQGDVAVVGFSIGGQVAIELAQLFPDRVDRLGVVSSLVAPMAGSSVLAIMSSWATPLASNERFARAQAKQLYIGDDDFDDYFAVSQALTHLTMMAMLTANFSFRPGDTLFSSPLPTLTFAGSREQKSLVRGMQHLAERMPAGSFELVEGVGHGIPLARPDAFNARLGEWLGERRGVNRAPIRG
ncbi:alpha/beta fold hydrolase [Salinibacterium hongtaonis]|uniref:AB hydrolase-1 domain-containing protein n=1 Tax=Homoserinimonas hongtaonis TaxID=2079791 RepID=A0A2U1T2T3_9MICO|nr:alpha/beta hydrolase [Salinibacterium hongtaonis]PWB98150.1 hypothetical protein DF220_10165 [Salinibacterium hongtaonis]